MSKLTVAIIEESMKPVLVARRTLLRAAAVAGLVGMMLATASNVGAVDVVSPPPPNARAKVDGSLVKHAISFNKKETKRLSDNGGSVAAIAGLSALIDGPAAIALVAAAAIINEAADFAVSQRKCLKIVVYHYPRFPTPSLYSGGYCR